MPTIRLLCLIAAAVALALGAAAASAGTPAQDMQWLNAKRAAHGIPAGIALDATWSEACARHVRYMRQTGSIAHTEEPSSPYFTQEGAWAARNAVLASTAPWTARNFIWERAPLHLAQLLAPQLVRTGIADDGQLVCATTLPGYTRTPPATPRVSTYPGNGAAIYPSEVASEWPMTPAEALGIGQPTGPNLLVYRWGPEAPATLDEIGLRRVELTGPAGKVRVLRLDRRHPTLGPYLPLGSGIVVPVAPLVRGAAYTAEVQFTDGTIHAWAFRARDAQPAAVIRRTRLVARRMSTRRVCTRPTPSGCRRWERRYRIEIRLRGIVRDRATGRPLARTRVEIYRRSPRRITRRTDAAGRFHARLVVWSPRLSRVRVTAQLPGDAASAWIVRVRR